MSVSGVCPVLVVFVQFASCAMDSGMSYNEYNEGAGLDDSPESTRESRIAARRKRVMMKIEAAHRAAQGKEPTSVSVVWDWAARLEVVVSTMYDLMHVMT